MKDKKNNTRVEEFKKIINSFTHDLKAEVIISELVSKVQTDDKDFLIDPKGQFKRPFRKDILGAEIIDFNYDDTQYIKVNLSRDGLYDILPEGVFHKSRTDLVRKSVEDMTKEYKANKKEEEYARKFFAPFENEFFLKSLEREDQEKKLLLELNGAKPVDFFYEFWGFDRDFPDVLMSKFIRILPYAYKVVGDLDLTVSCLSYILEENVEIAEQTYKEQSSTENQISLGDCRLGLDMISGSAYMDFSLYLEFKIGPLTQTSLTEYIHDGKIKKFIELFYEYFLPMEVDVKTTILLNTKAEEFNLKENPILGITTRI